jgi:hypothetical protein
MGGELTRTRSLDSAAGAAPSALRIESDAVSVKKAGSWFEVIAAVLATLLALLVSAIAAMLVVVAYYGYCRWRNRLARARPGVVRVVPGEGGGMFIDRGRKRTRIRRAKITDCWHWPDGRGVNVMVATRKAMISIQVPDRESATSLSKALGVDSSQQLVGTTLTAAPVFTGRRFPQFLSQHLFELVVVLSTLVLMLVVLPLVWVVSTLGTLPLLFVIALLPAVVGWTRDAIPSRVLVGRDGLLLSSFGRREFIGYERIKHARRAPFAATLTLTNDEIVLLPLSPVKGARKRLTLSPMDAWTREPGKVRARRHALVEQIDAALTRFRNAGNAAAIVGRILERGPRSIEEWRESIARAASGGYRDVHVDAALLLDIIENPRSPVGQRLGAALALTRLPDDESAAESGADRQQRVRAAIDSSANPRVRVALAHAADGTLDDATYEHAVEEEAAALQESTGPTDLRYRSRV